MWTRFSILDGAAEDGAPLLVVQDEDDAAVDPAAPAASSRRWVTAPACSPPGGTVT